MSERRRIFKVVLQITCQLFWLAGLVVGLSGVYLLLNFKHSGVFFRNIYIILPAILAIVSAVALLSSGGIGCWVSVRESNCLQATVDSELAPFRNMFQNYSGRSQDPGTDAVNSVQEELQCCGVHDYRDWITTAWFKQTGKMRVPQSCCNSTFHTCNGTLDQPHMLYSEGCQVKLEGAMTFILHLLIYSTAVVAVVQMVGLFSVAQLMKDQPLQEYRILDRDTIN
ncbi:tetraspanin 37 isoform X2 [Megalops cyprinoides]|uniref:tetraspanin 37 isoform X2 n=1 Tax=Megalops cyprinoides TaxID=118141 RepID=UPI001864D1BF|nr:tetraspanin 37 isoform X2 [Megalops cyprinoides]